MSVRVGFLGAGLIGTYHSKSLKASGADAVWAAVHDPDGGRAERFAEGTGAEVCGTEDEVLDRCDAVYICTWTSEHPRLVAAAAARGRHVFCEKPLATDLGGARAMAAAVDGVGVVNMVGLVLRRSPAFALLRTVAADLTGAGRPMSVVFRDDQYIPVQGMYGSTWRGDVEKAGAGTLLEHSIHDVDLLEWILGPITSVTARSAGFHEIDGIEDSVAVTIEFASGALGTLVSVWHDVLARPSLRRVELFSERAHCAVEGDWWGPVEIVTDAGGTARLEGEALEAEAARRGAILGNADGEFIRAIETGSPGWPSFTDALRAHEVVDAIYRSAAADGTPVACAPTPH